MELEGSMVDLKKKIVDLMSQCEILEEEKNKWEDQMLKSKEKEEKTKTKNLKLMEKFNSEERSWNHKFRQLVVDNKKLKIDLNAATKRRRDNEAEIELLKSSLEESNGRISTLLGKNAALDSQNCKLETDFKDKMALEAKKRKSEQQKSSELNDKIGVLERETEQMVGEVMRLKREKREEAERSCNVKWRLNVLEEENFELVRRIGVLESINKGMVEKISKLDKEKSEEAKKKLNEKMAFMEESKKTYVMLNMKIQDLEKEKREMEAKGAEIRRIKELRDDEISQKDEVIHVLHQENQKLEAQIKELKMQNAILGIKREDDMQ